MDLTPKNQCWPSLFHCCRPSTASPSICDDDEDEKEHDDHCPNNDHLFSTVPPLKVTTSTCCKIVVGEYLDTPTTACTDRSHEDDSVVLGRIDIDEEDSDDVSDPDEADYWYADSIDDDVQNQSGTDLYDIPEMADRNDHFTTNRCVGCKSNNPFPSQDHFDVTMFQLMALAMLPSELDQCTSNLQKKTNRKMMQRGWENADEEFEVMPQLHRDDESLSGILPIIELN